MRILVVILFSISLLGSASCTRLHPDLEVNRIEVHKGKRRLLLMHDDKVVARYRIDLGFAPEGAKMMIGDGRTPEGEYYITHRNPDSAFHLSLGISYPNEVDVARAEMLGRSPGGDIFIHGGPRPADPQGKDWTAGCIAVSDGEIEDIYARVSPGTPISIKP
jgi:murein L,D-transpeptidase YafK